jgi:hypothetical protein
MTIDANFPVQGSNNDLGTLQNYLNEAYDIPKKDNSAMFLGAIPVLTTGSYTDTTNFPLTTTFSNGFWFDSTTNFIVKHSSISGNFIITTPLYASTSIWMSCPAVKLVINNNTYYLSNFINHYYVYLPIGDVQIGVTPGFFVYNATSRIFSGSNTGTFQMPMTLIRGGNNFPFNVGIFEI